MKKNKNKAYYTQKEFSRLIGASVSTLRVWDKKGTLKAERDLTGHPFYTSKHLHLVGFWTKKKNYV